MFAAVHGLVPVVFVHCSEHQLLLKRVTSGHLSGECNILLISREPHVVVAAAAAVSVAVAVVAAVAAAAAVIVVIVDSAGMHCYCSSC